MNNQRWQLLGMAAILGAAMQVAAAETAAIVSAIASIRSSTGSSHSPDGKRIAFISNVSGSPQVWVLGPDGQRQVTKQADPVQSVAWNPAGDWLAYEVAPGGGLNVLAHVIRPDGSGDRMVTSGGASNNRLFGWTKDGKVLRIGSAAADPSRFEPQLIILASGAVTRVGEASAGLRSFLVSRDGRHVVIDRAVTRGDGSIWLASATGSTERLMTPHKGRAQFSNIGLPPDARRLWLIGNGDTDNYALVAVDIDADGKPGPMQTIRGRTDAELEAAELSDDGRTIALIWYKGGRSELEWFDTMTGKERAGAKLPVDIV